MKTFILPALLLALAASGCGDQSGDTGASTNDASSVSSVVTAPVDYLGALGRGKQTAEKTVDVAALTKAIQQFQVEKGRNPRDLNELVQEKYIPLIPAPPHGTKLEYDAATAHVRIVKE